MSLTFNGKPLHLNGTPPKAGEKIKDCILVNEKLEPITLYSLLGDCTLLLTIPSCDTHVCSLEMKSFQDHLTKNNLNVSCIVVSADLPFAQKRWLTQNPCANISLFSDYHFKQCGEHLGLFIQELALLARASFVINKDRTILYSELVSELSHEPNYKKILQSIQSFTRNKSA